MMVNNRMVGVHGFGHVPRFFALLLLVAGSLLSGCSGHKSDSVPAFQGEEGFRLPDVPAELKEPADRADYLVLHWWDHFDFGDTALVFRPEVTEQAFADFVNVLPHARESFSAVDTLFRRASADSLVLRHFMYLSDKYLYEPNSPLCNEELYIVFLRVMLASESVPEEERGRLRFRLSMACKNRPGDVVLRDGRRRWLHDVHADYILLFFNDPECDDCSRVKSFLSSSPVLSSLLRADGSGVPSLVVFAVCVEGDEEAWRSADYPSDWLNGFDEGQRLTRDAVYDLKAMPTLYLLDSEHRVVLKDASAEEVECLIQNS